MSSQSRLESFIESVANTAIGFIFGFTAQLLVFPLVGIYVPFSTNMKVCFAFTIVSIVRSYIVRRWFNARIHKAAMKIAEKI